MKALSLKLEEEIFEETEGIVKDLGVPRNRYINQALEMFNKYMRRKKLSAQLKKESALVGDSSLEVLAEFEAIEGEID